MLVFLCSLLIFAATLVLTWKLRGSVFWSLGMAGVAGTILWVVGPPENTAQSMATPDDRTIHADDPFISSRACRACHPAEYETWRNTYHSTMTQHASVASVLPPWKGELEDSGRTYRLYMDGERYMVDIPVYGTEGRQPTDRQQREVVMTTGSHHMQIYWIRSPFADAPDQQTGAKLFRERCASCHLDSDEETEPIYLDYAEIPPPEVRAALNTPDHLQRITPPLNETQTMAVLDYVDRIQIQSSLQQFPFAWWIKDGRWIHEEHTFLQPPVDPTKEEPYEQVWSNSCDECHSVAPTSSWDSKSGHPNAAVAELGIACEACHGSAKAHANANRNPVSRYLTRMNHESEGTIIQPKSLDHRRSSAVCGRCHSELVFPHGKSEMNWQPGELLEDHLKVVQRMEPPYPEWLEQTLEEEPDLLDAAFWKDGTMRVAGRDYNAMVLSGCYERGELSCLSCHQLHGSPPNDQLKPQMQGDAACIQCHPAEAESGESHTHHPIASEGSRCMNCHMPHTTIGLLGTIRSHRIDSPNAATAQATGRPDACSLCHLDAPLSRTAEHLTRWYGQPPLPETTYTLAPVSAAVSWFLRGDAAQRAVIASHMGWEPAIQASQGADWIPPYLAIGLTDPYAAVRYISGDSLSTFERYDTVFYDYTKDKEHQRAAARETGAIWKATPGFQRSKPEVLLNNGLDQTRLESYLHLRDHTPVSVSE